jgi:hypothetical protein
MTLLPKDVRALSDGPNRSHEATFMRDGAPLAAIPVVLVRIKESFGADTALDIGGFALVSGGALGLVRVSCAATQLDGVAPRSRPH